MSGIATLSIADDVRVVVPDSLELMTPYVLREQQDWFEDEIKFVRRLLQHGNSVVDIGANYGVYTLSMARAVGTQGKVLSFEPTSRTANFLQQGIAANGFDNIVLERSALSSAVGTARLSTSDHAELNTLAQRIDGGGEIVNVITLDEAMARHQWATIDFLKMDAEGEEARIIEGGRTFLSRCSPLILYEVKAADSLQLDLVRRFGALGYESYRLVPGLDVLQPFEPDRRPDQFLLNLFCCKNDRATLLAQRGLLVVDSVESGNPVAGPVSDNPRDAWQSLLALPYGAALAPLWHSTACAADRPAVDGAIADFLSSQNRDLSAARRVSCLQHSFQRLDRLCASNPTYMRRASLARVAAELGERSIAIQTLTLLQQSFAPGAPRPDLGEPFLAVTKRFEQIAPGENPLRWVLASALEASEKLDAHSSFFTGRLNLPRLEAIASFGYASDEMRRRLQLVARKPLPSKR